jgi:hypothetical protein
MRLANGERSRGRRGSNRTCAAYILYGRDFD